MSKRPEHDFDDFTETCRRCLCTSLELQQVRAPLLCLTDEEIATATADALKLSKKFRQQHGLYSWLN